jgi:hypothetical protein
MMKLAVAEGFMHDRITPKQTNRQAEASFLPEDRALCEELLEDAAGRYDAETKPLPLIAVVLGLHFLGAPYCPQLLGMGTVEVLAVDLRSFDCVTFVESVTALALTIQSGRKTFGDFLSMLEKIRYRNGWINGYPSRLHYFTDWIWDNEQKGLLCDVTSALGGIPVKKRFSFITSGRQECPPLRNDTVFQEMARVEAVCSNRPFYVIPKERWREAEGRIEDGDILAIATNRKDIDVLHVGFAVRVNKKIRLLHASSKIGRVALSESTLAGYLREKSSRTGVIVARVLPAPWTSPG